jgi:hypothetical protein
MMVNLTVLLIAAAPVHVTAAKMLSAEIMSKFQAQMSEYFNSEWAP